MPFIKNSTDIASEICTQIDSIKEEFKLAAISQSAAKNVQVEEACNQSYSDGVSITTAFQSYLSKASEFIGSVSQKLDSADQQVFKSLPPLSIYDNEFGGIHE